MMSRKVLVFEYMTSGCYAQGSDPHGTLLREGLAMRDAVVADFRLIPNIEVKSADNIRGKDYARRFQELFDWCDAALIIAPESGMSLTQLLEKIDTNKIKLLGPDLASSFLTSAKIHLAKHWLSHGVRTPRTYDFEEWFAGAESYPAVIKPMNGCGSWAVYRIDRKSDYVGYRKICEQAREEGLFEDGTIYQPCVLGRHASIAFLIGANQTIPLRPTFQLLSGDGRFRYLGGQTPIPPKLEERAIKLGRNAVECVPGLAGYVGVDMVLGHDPDGYLDYAIEINPRLTTSYVGLRALADFNIAQAMIDVVEGRPVDYVKWKPGRVQFWPDGRAEYDPTLGAVFS